MVDTGLTIYASIGFLGVALYLGSYAALQTGYITGQGGLYATLNLAAASCVLINLAEAFKMSSAIIQSFWIIISIIGLVRVYVINRRLKFTEDEKALVDFAFPGLSKPKARKILDAGHWIQGDPESVLTREEETNEHLIFLSQGRAQIESHGKIIATCEAPSFIGELTAVSGEPATATSSLQTSALYFSISAELLRRKFLKDPDIRAHLENCFTRQASHKLRVSNQALAAGNLIAKS